MGERGSGVLTVACSLSFSLFSIRALLRSCRPFYCTIHLGLVVLTVGLLAFGFYFLMVLLAGFDGTSFRVFPQRRAQGRDFSTEETCTYVHVLLNV